MNQGQRRLVLGIALGATLLATYLAPPSADDGLVLAERVASTTGPPASEPMSAVKKSSAAISDAPPVAPASGNFDVLSIRRRDDGDESEISVFRMPPSPPPVAKAAVPHVPTEDISPPQAPALPFRAIGRYVEEGRVAVFLQHNDQNLVVRAGETIDEQYKVETLSDTTLTLRYKPLNQLQTLNIGAPN